MEVSQKLRVVFQDGAISLFLSQCPKESLSANNRGTSRHIFIAGMFTTSKPSSQLRFPSMDEKIKEMSLHTTKQYHVMCRENG